MTNLLALCLVLTSLFVAEVWSPSPTGKQQVEDVIEKEGHRVIVVETYDQDGHHNTKVSISPEQPQEGTLKAKPAGVVETVTEKVKEASRVLPNLGQGISSGSDGDDQEQVEEEGKPHGEKHTPRELICDAFGRCTHRIAKAISKARDKASGKAHEVVEQEGEMVREAQEKVKEGVHEVREKVEDAYERVKETVAPKAHDVKESAKHKAKETVKSVADKGKDVSSEMYEKVEEAKGRVAESAKEAKEQAKNRFGRSFHRAVRYVTSPEARETFLGVVNLLGFATAYGTCLWITFVSSYVLARALPKQQFGMVQSKIYPVYFNVMAYSIGLALLAHLVGQRKLVFRHTPEILQAFNLLAAIAAVLVNMLYLEPLATKTMIERMKIEKEEGRGGEGLVTDDQPGRAEERRRRPVVDPPATADTRTATEGEAPSTTTVTDKPEEREQERTRSKYAKMNERLKTLNSYSSFLNILTLMALTWHLVHLGHRLQVHDTC
ncbi:hypothetical protein Tsubulata_049963 [Turnera subulata]|uniref:TMEM205-like domain-containing protein n=1 Tax=Turnera subulata TaxID=218843 RepID=A0A9Q0FEM5_9ROSI|nr:hypothetical protein Tsubulata_049963 [Turnera subulata]